MLARFSEDPAAVGALIERATTMVEVALADGLDAAIARFHAAEPGAKARERSRRREERSAAASAGDDDPAAEPPATEPGPEAQG